MEMMADGRLDAAIVTLPVLGNEIFEHRVCTDRLLLCMRRDDPLARFTEVPRQEIARRLRLLFHRDHHPPLHDMILRKFKQAGVDLRPSETYSAPAELQFLVRTRRNLGLVRDRATLDPELTARPMAGIEIRVGTAFVCLKGPTTPDLHHARAPNGADATREARSGCEKTTLVSLARYPTGTAQADGVNGGYSGP